MSAYAVGGTAGLLAAQVGGGIADAAIHAERPIESQEKAPETEEQKAARIAILERRADRDPDAAEELAFATGDIAYLEKLAATGDSKAMAAHERVTTTVDGAREWALSTGDVTFLKRLADEGDPQAGIELKEIQENMAVAVDFGRRTGNLTYLKKLAEAGDADAAFQLARQFDRPQYLNELVDSGNADAIIKQAEITGDIAPLKSLGLAGNAEAAYVVYEELTENGVYRTYDAWKWLCQAANNDHGKARARIGHWFRSTTWQYSTEPRMNALRNMGLKSDDRIAYMWYTLATSQGDSDHLAIREFVMTDMNPEEIAQAEQMARDWKPGDCPSAEHRLAPPGES